MKTFSNKVAVVTGAAGGIGRALARAFADAGADVAICDVADCSETLDALGGCGVRVHHETVDIGDKAAVRAFRDSVLTTFGHADVLVNNAGIALGDRTFAEVTEADMEKITNINYWGVVHTTQMFYPTLLARPESAIANISSTQGILGLPYLVPYCTTKFAVRGFTDALRNEHQVRGIRNLTIHCVHPGAVATNITTNADYHGANTERFHSFLQQGASPENAAQRILDGIRRNRGRIFISDGPVQDVVARLVPEHAHHLIRAVMRFQGVQIR